MSAHHEPLIVREVKLPSDRSFGLTFAAVFLIAALLPLLTGGRPRYWALPPAPVFLALALARPALLAPLNRVWGRFGTLLHKVVSPVSFGLFFYLILTPFAWAMRRSGRDPLRLSLDRACGSYWIAREETTSPPHQFTRQF